MRCLGVQFYGNELRKHVGTVRTILKVHVSVSSHLAFYRVPAVLYHNLGFFFGRKGITDFKGVYWSDKGFEGRRTRAS